MPPLAMAISDWSPWVANQVALTSRGMMFLGLPRYDATAANPSLARQRPDGVFAPFPGNAWNEWKIGDSGRDAFVYLNSVHIFADDTVWCVDQGAAGGEALPRPGAQKLVRLDPESGAVLDVMRFNDTILPAGARMNDLRFHGPMMYVTDSGLGGLIVHDMSSGVTRRRLSGRRELMASDAAVPALLQRGKDQPPFRPPHSDMIEITADGAWLYWAAPTGPLYRIATRSLNDPALSDDALAARIEKVADISFSSGCTIDTLGNLYFSETATGQITLLAPSGRKAVLASDPDLIKPDGSFINVDRRLYIPVKQSRRSNAFPIYAIALPEAFDGIKLGGAVTGLPI